MGENSDKSKLDQECDVLLEEILKLLNDLPTDEHIRKGKEIIKLFQAHIDMDSDPVDEGS